MINLFTIPEPHVILIHFLSSLTQPLALHLIRLVVPQINIEAVEYAAAVLTWQGTMVHEEVWMEQSRVGSVLLAADIEVAA